MRILFVCTGNVDKSKTAEEMFKNTKDIEAMHACMHGDLVWHLGVSYSCRRMRL